MMVLRMILTEGSDRFGFDSPWKNIKSIKEQKTEVDPFMTGEVNMIIERVGPICATIISPAFFRNAV
jgi:integrase